MSDERERAQGKSPGHEPLSVSIKGIAIGTLGLILLIGLTIWAMGPLARALSPVDATEEGDSFANLPAEASQNTVGLNPNQAEDRLALESQQSAWLSEYAWLSEEQQVARIPIERAMEIIRERGPQSVTQTGDASPATAEQSDTAGGSP